MAKKLDLDVDSPDAVPGVLAEAAQQYYEAALELESAWQDPSAGKIWTEIAKVLDRATAQVEKKLARYYR